MNILFDLPEVHQRIILSRWLSVEQLAAFDSAVCNHKYRAEYLAMIQSPECTFSTFTSSHATLADKWVIKRRLRFADLVLSGTKDPRARKEVLKLSAGTVQTMEIHTRTALQGSNYTKSVEPTRHDSDDCLLNVLQLVANSCTKLREFAILGSDTSETDADFFLPTWDPFVRLLQANKMLSFLHIGEAGNIDKHALTAICHLPNLTELHLTHCTFTAPFADLPASAVSTSLTTLEYFGSLAMAGLCQRLPSLTRLCGSAHTLDDAVALFACCPRLSSLELFCVVPFSDAACLTMAQSWPLLTQLTLQYVHKSSTVCSENALLEMIRHCPQLQYINTCNFECDKVVCPFDSERKDPFGDKWDELEEEKGGLRGDITGPGSPLQILRVDRLSEYGLCTIVELCKHLHTLAILHARVEIALVEGVETAQTRPSERALYHLANSSVKVLHLQNFTTPFDYDIPPLCNLAELCIAPHSGGIGNADIVRFVSRCPVLRVLCMVSASATTSDCFVPILDACPTLTNFEYYAHAPVHAREDQVIVDVKQTICRQYPKIKILELHF